MEAVCTNEDHANQHVWRSYFPHSIRLLQRSKDQHISERFSLSTHVRTRLSEGQQFKEAIKCLEDVLEWKQKILGEEDHKRLNSEHMLTSDYLDHRRIEEVVEVIEHVVEVRERTLREEDDDERLASDYEL